MNRPDSARAWLTRVSLAAGVVFTATAEYDLARQLGANQVVAAMLPVAVDAYVIAALRWFRALDIALSLALMGAAQVAAHLIDAKVMTMNGWLVVVVSLLVPVAIWRTHALARNADKPAEAVPETAPAPTIERTDEGHVPAVPESGYSPYPQLSPAYLAGPADTAPPPEADPPGEETYLAAEYGRTRPEVRAEYVPEADEPEQVQPDEDELTDKARGDFAERLAQGRAPSVRAIKNAYGIGQPRAQRIRDELKGARS